MINELGRAMLSDVGVDATMRSIYNYCSVHPRYCSRAPELLCPGTNTVPRPTFAADVYSLGHAIQEVSMCVEHSPHYLL